MVRQTALAKYDKLLTFVTMWLITVYAKQFIQALLYKKSCMQSFRKNWKTYKDDNFRV